MLEHNIVVLSKIYLNISFEQIGKFLEINKETAETIIGDMVTQNRIKASLDQFTNSIDFHVETGTKAVAVAGAQSLDQPDDENAKSKLAKDEDISANDRAMLDINKQIHDVCQNIDTLISDVLKDHPELQKYDVYNLN